jgi:glycine/D-amino acid oxidase-like deaminating enzyme
VDTDVIVIGGGLVGAAIAYGLISRRVRVLVLDGGDRDFRAANANFGLVWSQGKGMDMPAYQQLTRDSVDRWNDFSEELADTTGIDLQYERKGGLTICLGESEFESRRAKLRRLHEQLGSGDIDWEMIERNALTKLLPKVPFGPEVAGASYGRRDGHVNPLRLLAALHSGILRKGGQLRGGCLVTAVQSSDRGNFRVEFGSEHAAATRVVIAAGLGAKPLAARVGLNIPIRPDRGQILVTERLEPFLPLPISGMRQTREGTVLLGTTHDEPGYDSTTTSAAGIALSRDAIRRIPALSTVTLIRQWAGLRIMTPDSYPIYVESETHAGAFVTSCHSGVTLAPSHAGAVAAAIAAGRLPSSLKAFHPGRFDVPQAA